MLIQPGAAGGTVWAPMPYSSDTGYFYVPASIRTGAFVRYGDTYKHGQRYVAGNLSAPIGSPQAGTFTAISSTNNKIA